MSHPHLEHRHQHHRADKLTRLRLSIILTAAGMIVEFAGGFLSNSLALISDAGHMLTHLFALGMSYFAVVLALKPASKHHTYGFYRAEVLTAFVNGIVLVGIAGYIAYEALGRLVHPEEIKIQEMFLVALFGLVINGVSIALLTKVSEHDLNIKSAILHELGDMISSIAVVAGAIIIFYTKNYLVDSLLSLVIAGLIVVWAVRLLLDSAHILLESTPKHLDIDEIVAAVKKEIPDIHGMHHVHVWTIATSMYALTAHLIIEDCSISTSSELLRRVNEFLKERFHIEHTNIQCECVATQI
ncbi:MAG: cation diffusion facilitator family transporter [Candidatus Omnitrophota bacterium]|nr:cation diffusion facilitator family transporter [Candidatus Omnitrophota bacterium]